MENIKHNIINVNGINLHVAEQGEGPLVILCHGFPDLWYSWRHQLVALAEAGFHAVAPDQRGYGQTDIPESTDDYDILKLSSDIIGLTYALGEKKAFIVGHDMGSTVACHCSLLRPDIFQSLVLVSTPYFQNNWQDLKPSDTIKQLLDNLGEFDLYINYFQEPGKAENELEENVQKTFLKYFYTQSANSILEDRWNFIFNKSERYIDTLSLPENIPEWLDTNDLNYYTKEFVRTGFKGGLNWYRNLDRNWELTSFLNGAKIIQKAIYIAGEADGVVNMLKEQFDILETTVPNIKEKIILPDTGHWLHQEKPEIFNKIIIDFLKEQTN